MIVLTKHKLAARTPGVYLGQLLTLALLLYLRRSTKTCFYYLRRGGYFDWANSFVRDAGCDFSKSNNLIFFHVERLERLANDSGVPAGA